MIGPRLGGMCSNNVPDAFPEIFGRSYYYIAFPAAHTHPTNIFTLAIYAKKNHPNLYNINIRLYFIILYGLYYGIESRIPVYFFIFYFLSRRLLNFPCPTHTQYTCRVVRRIIIFFPLE